MNIEDKLYSLLSVYYTLPESFKKMIGKGYRKIPVNVRLGKDYVFFKELLNKEIQSTSVYEEYQENEFKKIISYAKKTKFYKKFYDEHNIDINSVRSLQHIDILPTINKKIIQKNLEAMVVPEKRNKKLYLTTSGSTGEPMGFYLEKGISRAKELAFIENMWSRVGYKHGDTCIVLRGQNMHSKNVQLVEMDYFRNWLFLSSHQLSPENIEIYVDILNKFRPSYIQGYPSSLVLLCKYLKKCTKKNIFEPKAILAGSENINSYQIKLIESTFNCKLYSWYGHSEKLALGGYGKNDNFYHFYPFYGYIEILNENSEKISKGIGEITATGFHNSVMPFIRYRTADMAISDGSTLTNGHILRIENIEGRQHEFILAPNGRKVSVAMVFAPIHSGIFDGIKQFQLHQKKIGKVIFKYTLLDNSLIINEQNIYDELKLKLGSDIELKIEKTNFIPYTKLGKHILLKQEINDYLNETSDTKF